MTTRTLAVAVVVAVAVAGVALVARPFLPAHISPAARAATSTPPPGIARLAVRQARRSVRCPAGASRPQERREGCGSLRVVRREVSCPTPTRCVAELVGDLHTTAITVPVALTVTVLRVRGTWRVSEVAS